MSTAIRIVKYQVKDLIRSRWLLGYTGFFLLATETLLRFGGDPTKAAVSLTNVILLMIPLTTLMFGTVYIYDAREFTELLLAQPVGRRELLDIKARTKQTLFLSSKSHEDECVASRLAADAQK